MVTPTLARQMSAVTVLFHLHLRWELRVMQFRNLAPAHFSPCLGDVLQGCLDLRVQPPSLGFRRLVPIYRALIPKSCPASPSASYHIRQPPSFWLSSFGRIPSLT